MIPNLNYSVIGNCRSAALISDKGSMDWCCLPEFDSPSIFAKILDYKKGGSFSFEVSEDYAISQKYLNNTNIVCTTFTSKNGVFEVIDFMPRYKTTGDHNYFMPAEIYRYIRLVSGVPSFKIIYNPKFNYSSEDAGHFVTDDHIRTFSTKLPTNCVYLYSSIYFNDILESNEITLTESQFLLLSYNQKLIEIDLARVELEFERTKVYWLNWSNRSIKYEAYSNEILRSLLVLKIMSFEPSGAVLAALTTSLPETIGEVRNWDYRFCWLRDASMSIETLLFMGHAQSAEGFLRFIKNILKSKQDAFQIMYGIRGERELVEEELPHLSGFGDSVPVRIGNAAYNQRQNDIFGYLLNVIFQFYTNFRGTLDEIEDMWEIVRNISRTVAVNWEMPDRGIWEIRGDEKHFVFSKVMSWVAMDRASQIATVLNKTDYAVLWRELADDIKADVFTHGWSDEIQSFTQTYCNKDVDASLLLMAEYGFIEANDVRYIKTVLAIKEQLFHKNLMYRYINADDFGKPSSSFTICTFWLVQALYRIGMEDEAKCVFNNLLSYSNHVGLFSEDISFETKQLLGNFPQAYSHLALINTATLFSKKKIGSSFIKP